MTQDQWHSSIDLRKNLEGILHDPTMLAALEILKDRVMTPTPVPAGVDLRDFYANLGAKKEGYFECLANLRSLSQVRATKTEAVKPWDNEAQLRAAPTGA